MKRNAFLITAVLFCLTISAIAADQKKNDAQPQAQPTEQKQMARYDADEYNEYASSTPRKHKPQAEKKSQRRHQQDNSERDPRAPKNQVEYGGAG